MAEISSKHIKNIKNKDDNNESPSSTTKKIVKSKQKSTRKGQMNENRAENTLSNFEQRRGSTPIAHLKHLMASMRASPLSSFLN